MKKELNLNNVEKISSIQEMLVKSSKRYSDKLALEDLKDTPISRVTYSSLLENVLKFGSALKKLGIKERTHIALIGENRVQWAISYLTAMCFNYVIVPIDKNLTENEIFNIVHESDSEVLIFSETFAATFIESRSSLSRINAFICMDDVTSDERFLKQEELINNSDVIDISKLPKIDPSELAGIIFTSGSLGRAKGVMLSQRNLSANLMDMLSMLMMYPNDRFLSILPIHHTYECTCGLLCPLYAGASVHYARSLKTIMDDLIRVKATILLGVPLLYDKMFKKIKQSIESDKIKSKVVPLLTKVTSLSEKIGLKNIKGKVFAELHKRFGGEIRVFIAGGAAPDPLVAKGLREFGFQFVQGYGLTETSPILALNRLDNFKDDAAGLPLPSVNLRINNPDEFGIGEIYAKAPSVMMGYYKNDDLTSEVFEGNWFRTGDLGVIDKDGFLHIKGRKKNVIISRSGKNVFPEEIEDILHRSPFVLECMVYGAKDKKQDEIIMARVFVDGESIISEAESRNHKVDEAFINSIIKQEIDNVNRQLPAFKRIMNFKIQEEEFIKTTTHKIKRHLN